MARVARLRRAGYDPYTMADITRIKTKTPGDTVLMSGPNTGGHWVDGMAKKAEALEGTLKDLGYSEEAVILP